MKNYDNYWITGSWLGARLIKYVVVKLIFEDLLFMYMYCILYSDLLIKPNKTTLAMINSVCCLFRQKKKKNVVYGLKKQGR